LDEYITKGVKYDEDEEVGVPGKKGKKKKKLSREPDITGITDLVSKIAQEEEGQQVCVRVCVCVCVCVFMCVCTVFMCFYV
jgi:hypothetical protein